MPLTKKIRSAYVCGDCGTSHTKWQGRCNGCGAWHTLVEEVVTPSTATHTLTALASNAQPQTLEAIPMQEEHRLALPDAELHRVLDGGIVPGSLILIGGEPGIGKSTLLLQLALRLAPQRVLYITGEESERQVKLRAARIPHANPHLYLLAETNLDAVLTHAAALAPALLVVDSIQTLYLDGLDSAPGSVAQVRECAARLMRFAKQTGTPTLLVGHINKEGMIAGPKVLEHMVDVVLEFEGDRQLNYRILRSIKNRFGATPELGIYEMGLQGMREVANPSEVFLSTSRGGLSGVSVCATLQAHRPLLVETQALVSDAAYGTPQRASTGYELRRLSMLLAVLEKKCGLRVGSKDVFVNLAGGIRLEDPALDLALAAAIVSSLYEVPLEASTAFAGEVGLTGEVRAVVRLEQRMAEAEKMGFTHMVVSATNGLGSTRRGSKLELIQAHTLQEAFSKLFQ